MDEHKKFLSQAIELSREHMQKGDGGPFGALIVRDGQVVGAGWNQVTSSNDPSAHAEIVAIRRACENLGTFTLKGAVIYTSCEPCPMCLGAVYWARLEKIYYANSRDDAARIQFDDEFLYREISRSISERAIPMQQLLHDEALAVFTEWAAKPDKIPY